MEASHDADNSGLPRGSTPVGLRSRRVSST